MTTTPTSAPTAGSAARQGRLLRPAPPREDWNRYRLGRFLLRAELATGRTFADYEEAWRWSVEDLEGFWQLVWDESDIIAHTPPERVLGRRAMPGAEWFPGATLNYAEHVVRALRERGDAVVLKSRSQTRAASEWTGNRLLEEIGRLQAGYRRLGLEAGDRVAGYLPNTPEALAAYLAAAGMGLVWAAVPPEMGPRSAIDRFGQLDPKLLITLDGYRWGARDVPRLAELEEIRQALPGAAVVLLRYLDADAQIPDGIGTYEELRAEPGEFEAVPVPFAHPLTVLFSSGTTGKPKAIVHSHGGILLEHSKAIPLQFDLGPDDLAFWYTTTGWMVWTLMVSSLLTGCGLVLVDGDPGWPALDGEWSQWAVAAETGATYLASGSAYLAACAKAGLRPGSRWDLGRLREINCSGSALSAEAAEWVYDAVSPTVLLGPTSGGTDVCTAFVGGTFLTEVRAGEMSCRALGADVAAWSPAGEPAAVGEPGELVVKQPMPSMPTGFWGPDGAQRYRDSYFHTFEGVWCHGDWLVHTADGGWMITGRSDATLNRGGVRLGTAEFYAVLDQAPGVADSMVLHFEDGSGMGKLVLAVVPSPGADPDELAAGLRRLIRTQLSPRHVPDVVVAVPSVPRSSIGKRLEVPLKRIVLGAEATNVVDRGVLVDPDGLDATVAAIRAALGHDRPPTA
ncbi:acetoacetyl-CoA synthetase [Sinomonas cyclohexanicum]|uniref:Acetoacetyl-CoA synthetase n=1 Tax=Sinomonas cyclohexanicum TaxID=322009 RepID=A0ABM7Q0B7_SINCY|nr:acetoacetate--CoA ligase [Corynebacterium cyclohexanicum]BCT78010.1 acetoacetyl-CoA synthetase [Corynebacterium cyclohexanicum]